MSQNLLLNQHHRATIHEQQHRAAAQCTQNEVDVHRIDETFCKRLHNGAHIEVKLDKTKGEWKHNTVDNKVTDNSTLPMYK